MTINAPYNFVPLSRWIYSPPWQSAVSQDLPFKDGFSGSIELTITAHTPILVGGQHGERDPINFFSLPDETGQRKPIIPGSTLRGMTRNVLEIAAFGKMQGVDDRRLGVRDLTSGARPFYGSLMSRTISGAIPAYEPRVKAGWLSYDAGKSQWNINACEFARVEHSDLEDYASVRLSRFPSSEEKYRQWLSAGKSLNISFTADSFQDHRHSRGKLLHYRKALNLGTGTDTGTLVFTGQPGPKNKHMEFIFFDSAVTPRKVLPVDDSVWNGFIDIHGETNEWRYWKGITPCGPIPVFFLLHAGRIESLGMAMMYKLAYRHTIGETIDHTNPSHRSDAFFDLPELIFGAIRSDVQSSLKGRACFSHAVCENNAGPMAEVRTILNSPKPTYYPNYIRQNADQNTWKLLKEKAGYQTYLDASAEIRGWKRYPVRNHACPQVLTHEQATNQNIQARLNPLEGARFSGHLHFHNLKPEELGAIIWALTWGEYTTNGSPTTPRYRHAVGMGKSFGYGQVSVRLSQPELIPNLISGQVLSLEECVNRFTDCMNEAYQNAQEKSNGSQSWKDSRQLQQLLAMADPGAVANFPGRLQHMRLEPNEFVAAKNKLFVLPEFSNYQGLDDSALFPLPLVSGTQPGPNGQVSTVDAQGIAWVDQTIGDLVAQNRNAKPDDILRGKMLAEAWQGIVNEVQKLATKTEIEKRWRNHGWWDAPQGKSAKAARRIYGE